MAIQHFNDGDTFAEVRETINSNFDELSENIDNQIQILKDNGMFVCGVYTGDGAEARTISLGFEPIAVLIITSNGIGRGGETITGGLALKGHPSYGYYSFNEPIITIVSNGFRLDIRSDNRDHINDEGEDYYFIALKTDTVVEK